MFSERLNVVICIESFYDGGAEIFAIRLANAIADLHNIYFLELEPYDTVEKNQLKLLNQDKVKLVQPGKGILRRLLFLPNRRNTLRKGLPHFLYQFYYWKKAKSLTKFLTEKKIDIIHSNCWTTDYYFALHKKESSYKLVFSLHGHYEALRNQISGFADKASSTLNSADKIIFLTKTHLATLNELSVDNKKLYRIFYGLDFEPAAKPTEIDGRVLKLLFVARGIPEKGWEQLIAAVNNLLEKKPGSVSLKMVGSSAYVDDLKLKHESSAIEFCGYQDDVLPFVKKSHVCLLPSYYPGESLPNSIIEYMSGGKPVISTDIGSISEMITVDSHVAGCLLRLKDGKPDVNDIVEAINVYIEKPEMIKIHSQLSIKGARKFAMNECVSEYNKIYQEL